MTEHHWPNTLWDAPPAPIEPHCPVTCCFRELCPTLMQKGIAGLFRRGRYRELADCLFYERLAELCRQEFEHEPPASPRGLRNLMRGGARVAAGSGRDG